MVWNEQLKREIPEGWCSTKIHQLADITWGQCPDGRHILDRNTKTHNAIDYCSGAGDMKGGFLVDCQAKTDASKRRAKEHDILVSVAGKIGDMCIVDHDISLGRAAMAYSVKNVNDVMFLYFTLQNFNKKLTTISSGSIQKVINSNHIEELYFAYSPEVVVAYSNISNQIYHKLVKIAKENKQLSKLRDWLLPMLMNGQATIED